MRIRVDDQLKEVEDVITYYDTEGEINMVDVLTKDGDAVSLTGDDAEFWATMQDILNKVRRKERE